MEKTFSKPEKMAPANPSHKHITGPNPAKVPYVHGDQSGSGNRAENTGVRNPGRDRRGK